MLGSFLNLAANVFIGLERLVGNGRVQGVNLHLLHMGGQLFAVAVPVGRVGNDDERLQSVALGRDSVALWRTVLAGILERRELPSADPRGELTDGGNPAGGEESDAG